MELVCTGVVSLVEFWMTNLRKNQSQTKGAEPCLELPRQEMSDKKSVGLILCRSLRYDSLF